MISLLCHMSWKLFPCSLAFMLSYQVLIGQVENFEKWVHDTKFRIMRPNTMNKYGAVLDDFGLETMLDKLMEDFVRPMSRGNSFLGQLNTINLSKMKQLTDFFLLSLSYLTSLILNWGISCSFLS